LDVGEVIESEASQSEFPSSEELKPEEGGLADLEEICQSIGSWWTKKNKKKPISTRGISEEKLYQLSRQTGIGVQRLKQRLDEAIALG